MNSLSKLFQSANIGTMQLHNRIIMAPMGSMLGNEDGSVSERLRRYYEERAKGGAALIIVEATAIAPEGKGNTRQLCIYGDEFIAGLRHLVDSVHAHGAKIAIELHHMGKETTVEAAGEQPVAPSAIPSVTTKVMPRELTIEEIEHLVEAYTDGVERAKEVGFDAVEFHGAHGYLICQFLSNYSNKRTDKYGGDLENRMRFALDIVTQAKARVGNDFPMLFRLSAQEYVPKGLTLDETRILSQRLQDAGIHCLDVSAGNSQAANMVVQPGWMPRGCLVPLAVEIKGAVSIPVSIAGRINDPVLANEIVEQGKADFVTLGRPLLADPELPNKAREGRLEDIRMCTGCCHCMDVVAGTWQPLTCAINATVGKEETAPMPALKPKTVLVVGGGPGGMEAARVAALRGHKVTLYEQDETLGGQLLMAAIPPGKEELATTTRFLSLQLYKLGVEVKISQRATVETIAEMKPDAVVLATGSSVVVPDIEGAKLPHVTMAREVISGRKTTWQKVVIVGGGRVGCETAELLAKLGKEITVVRMTGYGRLAGDIGVFTRKFFLAELHQWPIVIENDSAVERITREGVIIKKNGQSILVNADSVVLSPAPSSNGQLAEQINGLVTELYIIGDCAKPRGIADAIHEGFQVGCEL